VEHEQRLKDFLARLADLSAEDVKEILNYAGVIKNRRFSDDESIPPEPQAQQVH
jgi:hypothetical protein